MKIKATLLTLSLVASLAVPAFAGHGGFHGGSPTLKEKFFEKFHFLMKHREELKLSDEQVNDLTDLKYSVKKGYAETDAQMEVAKINMLQELKKPDADLNKVNGFIDSKIEAKRRFEYDTAKALIEVKKVLNADQVKLMKELWMKDQYSKDCKHG